MSTEIALGQARETKAFTILDQHQDLVISHALFSKGRKSPEYHILGILQRDEGVEKDEIDPKMIRKWLEIPKNKELLKSKVEGTAVAVHDFRKAGEIALKTSEERVKVAQLLMARIEDRGASEHAGGRYSKGWLDDVKAYLTLLESEDKKHPTGVATSGLTDAGAWPDDDPNVFKPISDIEVSESNKGCVKT